MMKSSPYLTRINVQRVAQTLQMALLLLSLPACATPESTSRDYRPEPGEAFFCGGESHLVVDESFVEIPKRYASIRAVFDCESRQLVIEFVTAQGRTLELDRFTPPEGARVELRISEKSDEAQDDLAVVIYGFDPGSSPPQFVVDVYHLDTALKAFSVPSSSRPRIADINRDGVTELVVYSDIFSVGRPGGPHWPIAYRLGSPIVALDVPEIQQLIEDMRLQSLAALEHAREMCRVLDHTPCPLESEIAGLSRQLEAAEALMR